MKKIILMILMVNVLLLSACTTGTINPGDYLGGGGTVTDVPSESDVDDVITDIENTVNTDDSDLETVTEYDSSATIISLDNANTTIDGSGAVLNNGNVIEITSTGNYVLSGNFNGHIYVNVDGNVHLYLSGCNITSSDTAAIILLGKKKKVITLVDDTENYLTDSSAYSVFYNEDNDEPNGALFAKKALTINGNGSLTITGNYNNGISCKDELKILSGTIKVTANNNGIKGNDSIIIKGGDIEITAKEDGMKSDNEDEGYGTIYIENAKININAEEDGIQAYRYLYIASGEIEIKTYGGATSTSSSSRPNDWNSSSSTETSRKGIKSDISILIEGGDISLNTYDDAIHANDTVIINNGNIVIQSGDDGIHADSILKINNGNIEINKSYEGIEAAKIDINSGYVTVISSDDGINAADGSQTQMGYVNSNCSLIINGGNVYVDAAGDGVDSNGTIVMNGGSLYISGPTNSGNGSLDSEGGFLMNGGILIAVGSLGMVETPASNSSQYVVSYASSSNIVSNTTISIRDSNNNILASFTPNKQYRSVIISCPELSKGSTYSIYGNDSSLVSFTISSVITTVGSSTTGGGGRPGGRPW